MFEWLVDNGWVLWLVLFLGLAAVEVLTLDLFFIMLSAGALAALISTFLGAPFWLQAVIFCAVALLMILLVRPWALRHLHRGGADHRSNVERLIGQSAVTLGPVTGVTGLVKIGGDTWSARSADGGRIDGGRRVAVLRIEGATAVVGPLPQTGRQEP